MRMKRFGMNIEQQIIVNSGRKEKEMEEQYEMLC